MAQKPVANALTLELEPVCEANMDRHLNTEELWFAHDYVPFDRGENFSFLGGRDWDPSQATLPLTRWILDATNRAVASATAYCNPSTSTTAVKVHTSLRPVEGCALVLTSSGSTITNPSSTARGSSGSTGDAGSHPGTPVAIHSA